MVAQGTEFITWTKTVAPPKSTNSGISRTAHVGRERREHAFLQKYPEHTVDPLLRSHVLLLVVCLICIIEVFTFHHRADCPCKVISCRYFYLLVCNLIFLICLLQHVVSQMEIPFGYLVVPHQWRDAINVKFPITKF